MLGDFETSSCNGEQVFGIDNRCQNEKGQECKTSLNSHSNRAHHFVLRGGVYCLAFGSGLRYRHRRSRFCLSDLRFRFQPEIASHLLDYVCGNNFSRPCIGAKQGVVADDIYQPGNPVRIKGDLSKRIRMKKILTFIPSNAKSKINIGTHLLVLERNKPALKGNPLFKLPETRSTKSCLKLRLTHQYNLDQLFLIGLQIGEKSETLESFITQILSFID